MGVPVVPQESPLEYTFSAGIFEGYGARDLEIEQLRHRPLNVAAQLAGTILEDRAGECCRARARAARDPRGFRHER